MDRHGKIHQIVKAYEKYRDALALLDSAINELVFIYASKLSEEKQKGEE